MVKLKSIVWIILLKNATLAINKGSSEIWSDKVSLLHIKGTQRGGEHGGESRTISRRCRRHKERQSRSIHIADSFGNKRINLLRNLANHYFVMK